jgi:hypothetical protein
VTEDIEDVLGALEGDLSPIREVAKRHWALNGTIDPKSGAALLNHRPNLAPEAYALILYPGLALSDLARYEELTQTRRNYSISIPSSYRQVLSKLNGAFLFQATLYGAPRSMIKDPPLLDRSARQPLDVAEANRHWKTKYKTDPSLFHFGSGPHSHTENLGYFVGGEGGIETYLPGGKHMGTWRSLREFLADELARLEALS